MFLSGKNLGPWWEVKPGDRSGSGRLAGEKIRDRSNETRINERAEGGGNPDKTVWCRSRGLVELKKRVAHEKKPERERKKKHARRDRMTEGPHLRAATGEV